MTILELYITIGIGSLVILAIALLIVWPMVKKAQEPDNPKETALVELIIRVEGSDVINRIAVFELPINGRVAPVGEESGQIEFTSKDLVKVIRKSLDKMI